MALANMAKPPTGYMARVLLITFAGSTCGRQMRDMWTTPAVFLVTQKLNGAYPEFGLKPAMWRLSQLYQEFAQDAGVEMKGKSRGKGLTGMHACV